MTYFAYCVLIPASMIALFAIIDLYFVRKQYMKQKNETKAKNEEVDRLLDLEEWELHTYHKN